MANASGQGSNALVPMIGTVTEDVTVVQRSRIEIGTSANINAATTNAIPLASLSTNELGISVAGNIANGIPAGNIEFFIHPNLDANGARTNFKVLIRNGTTVLDTAYGSYYGRNASGHDETGATVVMSIEGFSGGNLNFALLREAAGGDVDLDGGWIILKRYETKSLKVIA